MPQSTQSIDKGRMPLANSVTMVPSAKQSTMRRIGIALLGVWLLLSVAPFEPLGAAPRDEVRRTAIISAFQPEWLALQANLTDREERVINETVFVTGTIAGKAVVLFLSGISMVNAAMTNPARARPFHPRPFGVFRHCRRGRPGSPDRRCHRTSCLVRVSRSGVRARGEWWLFIAAVCGSHAT